ncbi:alpha-2,8-sialyltransferase 8B-like [Diadema antillarum]|uniref:alpha-2,8-sialyltransferase 8B-like n=1 Tax=Diadema antillarum TaxID=105358 RepID=UPI003A83D1E4
MASQRMERKDTLILALCILTALGVIGYLVVQDNQSPAEFGFVRRTMVIPSVAGEKRILAKGRRRGTPATGGCHPTLINLSGSTEPYVHRLPNRNVILRRSKHWANETQIHGLLEMRETGGKGGHISDAELHLFLNTNANESAYAELQKIVSTRISRCLAMQIFRDDVPLSSIKMESTPELVSERNQTDCVPMQGSCALVGNSGILLDSRCGDVIDAADFVIRNNAPSLEERYREDIGTRTDAMTMNLSLIRALIICTKVPTTWRIGKLPPRTTCPQLMKNMNVFQNRRIFWFLKRYDRKFQAFKSMMSALKATHHLNFRLAYSPVVPMAVASKLASVRIPSSGLAAFAASTQFCRSINLFGFYPFNTAPGNRAVPSHYYDESLKGFSIIHRISKEFRLLVDLEEQGAIKVINDCK